MNFNRDLSRLMVGGIDGKTVAATSLGSTENGTESFHPLYAVVQCTNASLVIVVPAVSIGQNSTSFNDIITATTLTNLNASNKMTVVSPIVATQVVPANTGISVRVTTGATATTCTLEVGLWGYYR